ncbi:hypothetical protein F511_20477 [Dorcoceras hygrometricum]|uniref:Uncharacterized protein n=1 Tax=Dorcoceras hygrometricum TaxID=472368 RepID=A0A2Z7BLX4_9LAMI|nr:hypothetical protein F511_20477 [Dorcoceras hygrometricum]
MLVQEQSALIPLVRKGSDLTLKNRRDMRSDQTRMRCNTSVSLNRYDHREQIWIGIKIPSGSRYPLEDIDYTSECTIHSAGTYSLPKAELVDSTPALSCVHSITRKATYTEFNVFVLGRPPKMDDVTTAEYSISLDDVSRLLKSSISLDDVTTAEIFNSLIFCETLNDVTTSEIFNTLG